MTDRYWKSLSIRIVAVALLAAAVAVLLEALTGEDKLLPFEAMVFWYYILGGGTTFIGLLRRPEKFSPWEVAFVATVAASSFPLFEWVRTAP